MKKYIKFIIPIVLIVILSICLIIVNITTEEELYCSDTVSFEDIFREIDLFSNSTFTQVSEGTETMYFPINFELSERYFVAANETNTEYFAIIKNLSDSELIFLEDFVENRKKEDEANSNKYKVVIIKDYVVAIISKNYSSAISGIANSYINCE